MALIDTLSVLFTDLVGSTESRARLGEDAADRLRRTHDELLTHAVNRCGGSVVKGLGDGILATFASAADAVAAAVAIQQAADSHGRRHPDQPLSVRVGVSVGDVSVEEQDVFGAPVVEASRLCASATGSEILVADLVRALSRGRGGFIFEPVGDLELKGIAEPVPACRVAWPPLDEVPPGVETVPLPSLLVAGETTGYVGRALVLQRLAGAWASAEAGGVRVVLLAGEPGIGKTRTAAEAARVAYREGALVLYGRCDEDLAVPYQPFVEALDWYSAHAGTPLLGRLPGELRRLLPELATRITRLPPSVATDPRSEEHRLFEAVTSWLVEVSRVSGLVLVVDDLHWAEKATLLLLLHLLRAATATEGDPARLLIIGNYRDTDIDRTHPLSGLVSDLRRLPGVERVPLDGLTAEEITAFIETAAGHELDEPAQLLAVALHAETEGNPFFIGEVLRHLVETGQVRRVGDRWVVAVDPEHLAVPEGVRDVVGRRLSRLSENANAVLSVAAVLGRDVELEVLLPLVDAGENAVLDALDEAVRARLLEEMGPDRYRFGHALVRSTLYDELSATRRRRLHRRVADVLEKIRPDDVVALSYHAIEGGPEGGDVSRAVRYTIAAGDQALAGRAAAEAEARYRQALELLEDAGDDESLLALMAVVGLGEAERDQAKPAFRETLLAASRRALAAGHTDLLVRAVLANHRGVASVAGGTDTERVELIEAALAETGDEPTPERARLLANLAGEVAYSRSEPERVGLADEAEALARSLGDPTLVAWVITRSGFGLFTPRRWRTLPARLAEATELADGSGDPSLRVQARFWWSGALLTAGEATRARQLLEEAEQIAEVDGSPLLVWEVRSYLAHHLAMAGDLAGAEAAAQASLEAGLALREPDAHVWWAAILAVVAWCRRQAEPLADATAAFADQYPEAPEWRWSQIMWLAMAGRVAEARDVLRDAPLDLQTALQRPLPFHGLAVLGWSAFLLDDADLARQVERALAPYQEAWAHYFVGAAGPVAASLAVCAFTYGDLDLAVDRMDRALTALTAHGWQGEVAAYSAPLTGMLLARDGPGDRARALQVIVRVQAAAAAMEAPSLAAQAAELAERARSSR
jgi:class 3 adenylate cyclase/tetratricopeptide (TPR) repeat protein